jgi:hypothetical protein
MEHNWKLRCSVPNTEVTTTSFFAYKGDAIIASELSKVITKFMTGYDLECEITPVDHSEIDNLIEKTLNEE